MHICIICIIIVNGFLLLSAFLEYQSNSVSLGSVGNRIITSGGHVVTTVPGLVGSSSNKPVVVNAAQLGSGRHQVVEALGLI